jgi:hypothetical protein
MGKTFNSFDGTPINNSMFEMILVMLKEWFKSTVSEPVKFVPKNPLSKSG